jgi:lysozyme
VLKDELVRDEGLRLVSYRDSVGLWTIGVGHLLGEKQRMTEITKDEAMALLNIDMDLAELRVVKLLGFVGFGLLGEVRQRALVNMAFNLGGRLAGFKKFIAAVNTRDWATAGREMADSQWAKQVGDRAVRLRQMIETGVA